VKKEREREKQNNNKVQHTVLTAAQYTHTQKIRQDIINRCKMADEVSEEIEDALQLIVNMAEQSSNMKK